MSVPNFFRWMAHGLLAYVPLLVCGGLTLLASFFDGSSFNDVVLLPPEGVEPFRLVVAVLAYLTGYFGLYFAPGYLLMRALRIDLRNGASNALAAFTLSLIGLSLAWIAARAVAGGEAGRASFYLTVGGFEAAVAAAAWARNRDRSPSLSLSAWARKNGWEFLLPAAGILLMLALGCLLMPGKIAVESLEGDATEIHGFAASLLRGAFPEWDLEVGVWGFYPTFMFVSYPVFFSLALGGISEAALRLPALLFLGVLILAMAELAGRGRARKAGGAPAVLLPLLATGYLSLQVGAYYSGYDPFHGDLASSPIVEWLVTALAISAVVFIRDEAPGLGAIAAFLAIVAFPSGLMLVGILGAAGFLVGSATERRALLKSAFVLLLLVAGYSLFFLLYTSAKGTLEPAIEEWWSKYFAGRAGFTSGSPARTLRALSWYVLLAGGLPVIGYGPALFSRDSMARWLALAGFLWVAFFLLSPVKNIHYFLPAALIPVAVAIRAGPGSRARAQMAGGNQEGGQDNTGRRAWLWPGLLTVSAVVVIILSWPKTVPPYTADREFGRTTVFLASTEREAVEYSEVIYGVVNPLVRWKAGDSWTTGHHTWVRYADRAPQPSREYELYVGREKPPVEELQAISRLQLADGQHAFLWAREGGAALGEWQRKLFPLKRDLSRFNFDLEPERWN
ncbi:MAG: hypothetical protein A3F90_06430 [Deltaproteobacteria bacterium RIFCSPLOWO2_12_FULL_60_19]|nr:MAG: hypothetical protein A3F90_06430 [Deltaproteobacteria bacterium RIFCSPLOWO2_12_FULL_60_19]